MSLKNQNLSDRDYIKLFQITIKVKHLCIKPREFDRERQRRFSKIVKNAEIKYNEFQKVVKKF